MDQPKYIQVASEVEKLYWQKTAGEIQDELGIGGSTYGRAKEYVGLPRKTNKNRIEHVYGVPAKWLLDTLHNVLGKSVNQMSDDLHVSRKWISGKMDDWGVNRRGQSQAESLKWEQMSTDEREQQVAAAHKAVRTHPGMRVNKRGYETIRHCQEEVKHHRLLATLLVDDLSELKDKHVHHDPAVSWLNAERFLTVLDPTTHLRNHYKDRSIDELGRFE